MNDVFDNLSDEQQQQRLLDRLVDGEIGRDEQRQLILSLEAQPDGWRRCAMAFLEAQAWGSELKQITGLSSAPRLAVAKSIPTARRSLNLLRPLAVAIGLMLAFTLGMAVQGTTDSGTKELAAAPVGVNSPSADSQKSTYETVKVSLPSSDGDSEQTLELPLIEADQTSFASLIADEKPVLSDVELKTLESTGHQVEQRRAYYPVQLQDGRQGVLPMDLVEVKYTGGWQ